MPTNVQKPTLETTEGAEEAVAEGVEDAEASGAVVVS